MADDYKSSREWQALNRIWKAVPGSAREAVRDDFRLIAEFFKGKAENPAPQSAPTAAPAPRGPRENYLEGMSDGAKRLALRLLTREGFDIYAFMEELMVSSGAEDAQELWDAYVSERDMDDENEDAIREICSACISRRR
jgi:hypothetical protein